MTKTLYFKIMCMILLAGYAKKSTTNTFLENLAKSSISLITIGRPTDPRVTQIQHQLTQRVERNRQVDQLRKEAQEQITIRNTKANTKATAYNNLAKEQRVALNKAREAAQEKLADEFRKKQLQKKGFKDLNEETKKAKAKKEADAIKAKETEADEQTRRKMEIKAKINPIHNLQAPKPTKPLLLKLNPKDPSEDLANFKKTIDDHQEDLSSTDVIHSLRALNEKVASIPPTNLTKPMIDNYEKSITTLLEKHKNSALTKPTNTNLHKADEDDIKNVINDYRIAEVKETMGLDKEQSPNDIKKQLQKILYALPHDAEKQIELITAFNKQEKQKNTNPTWITARKTVANWVKTNKKWTAALVATVVAVIGIALNSALSDGEDDEGEE